MTSNKAHSLDGAIPSLFHAERYRRAASDAPRSAAAHIHMKTLIALLFLSATIARGEDGTNGVAKPAAQKAYPPAVFVNGTGHKWYSVTELEQIAKDYAKQKKIQFDFAHAGRSVWVHTDGSNVIARVVFASDFGKPMYYAEVDRHGIVVTNFIGVMSEGPP